MKYSQLFGKTVKETPRDIVLASHKLLYQGGYLRESTAGRYYLLTLGMKVHQKIQKIVKEEMDKAGAQEIITPILHPKALWKETNRTASVGFELTQITDRSGSEFVLGGTAEEMLVDLIRKFQISYKDLPINLYQFSVKFRDEFRARGGLLRLREFVMKDAYSFHATEKDFRKEYENMRDTYSRIFNRIGLKTKIVESDNGYIGGEYCDEFVVESEVGESKYVTTKDGAYAAHLEVAKFQRMPHNDEAELEEPLKEVEGVGIIGCEELATYLHIPLEKTTKTILFENEKGNVIAAAVQGGYEVNEAKLKHVSGSLSLTLATEETIRRVTGAKVGYAGLIHLPKDVHVYIDESLKGRKNFEMGANKTNYHTINVNFGRDLKEPENYYDIAVARVGDLSLDGQELQLKKGIEVGNIFQLGYHYSSKMQGAEFTDENGEKKQYYMGCYGIGIARTLATVVEVSHDEKGIIWPETIAPFATELIDLFSGEQAERVYNALIKNGVDVLYDDRDISAGEKFADCDLVGIPVRLVVSKKTGDKIEWKMRNSDKSELITLAEVLSRLQQLER